MKGKPELVLQVAFMEWTKYDKLRDPRLVGIRADKRVRDQLVAPVMLPHVASGRSRWSAIR